MVDLQSGKRPLKAMRPTLKKDGWLTSMFLYLFSKDQGELGVQFCTSIFWKPSGGVIVSSKWVALIFLGVCVCVFILESFPRFYI